MRAISAAVVIGLVLAPCAQAGQAAREASDWGRIRGLAPGTIITLETGRRAPLMVRALRADDDTLVVVNPFPALPQTLAQRLWALGAEWRTVLDGRNLLSDDLTVTPAGVFQGGQQLASLDQVVERVLREDVVEVRGTVRRGGSVPFGVAGAAAGFLAGTFVAISMADKDCGGDCADEKLVAGVSLVGLPVLGGVAGYRLGRHPEQGVLYRAPRPAPVTVDDAAWRRIRQALPPSLRGNAGR